MQSSHSQNSPQKEEQTIQRIIYPQITDPADDEEFVLIDCAIDQQLLTQFPQEDLCDIKIKVIDYIYQKSYVILSTETFIIKIYRTQDNSCVELQQSRSVSDFEWLRKTLQSKYPGIGIPVFHIAESIQNLTKEKIIVVEQFLKFLIQHVVLKYSPQVKAFLSDKIEYLEMRKEIEASPNEYTRHKGNFELSTILSALKPWKKFRSLEEQPLKISNIKEVVPKEGYFKATINSLQKMIQYFKKGNDLNRNIIASEKQSSQKPSVISEFSKLKQTIKCNYKQNKQKTESYQSLQYLRLGIKMQMVKQNILSYSHWFDRIRKIEEDIIIFKQNQEFNKSYMELNYLKLLINNMARDMASWTQYNNNLIQDSLYEL